MITSQAAPPTVQEGYTTHHIEKMPWKAHSGRQSAWPELIQLLIDLLQDADTFVDRQASQSDSQIVTEPALPWVMFLNRQASQSGGHTVIEPVLPSVLCQPSSEDQFAVTDRNTWMIV